MGHSVDRIASGLYAKALNARYRSAFEDLFKFIKETADNVEHYSYRHIAEYIASNARQIAERHGVDGQLRRHAAQAGEVATRAIEVEDTQYDDQKRIFFATESGRVEVGTMFRAYNSTEWHSYNIAVDPTGTINGSPVVVAQTVASWAGKDPDAAVVFLDADGHVIN